MEYLSCPSNKGCIYSPIRLPWGQVAMLTLRNGMHVVKDDATEILIQIC